MVPGRLSLGQKKPEKELPSGAKLRPRQAGIGKATTSTEAMALKG
jgi:hypothetical protein